MAESNIDGFDKNVGIVFALLYEQFPLRVTIDETFVIPNDLEMAEGWEVRYQKNRKIYISTMEWLVQAGYVWTSGGDSMYGIFSDCVLSSKGLEVLKAVPDSLSTKSIGAQLQEATQEGLLSSVKTLTEKALGLGASMGYSMATNLMNP
ncbi:hypothetical protein [Pseudomonas tolaasii]|uniref:hypothetical protein n=1 Tax=Pseudomonas tolaasii TaxID=29442 RepID=UPI002737450D|nr:hypothetical protein [Pseudomonas tolaasii]WLH49762.1 hypothetical protein PSH62_16840 [Pseudomonas tolaasii]